MLQQAFQLGPDILRPEKVWPDLKKRQRVLDCATVSGLNSLQPGRIAPGESQGIIMALKFVTSSRPLGAGLGTAVPPVERLMDARAQLSNAPGVRLNETSGFRFLFHDDLPMA